MLKCIPVILVTLFLETAAAAPAFSPQLLKDAPSILVVSAIEPTLLGTKNGVTVFNAAGWSTDAPGFDINAALLDALRTQANRELKYLPGKEAGIIINRDAKDSEIKALSPKLTNLAQVTAADAILLVHSTKTDDFVENRRNNGGLAGVGHFYSRREGAYIVLQATLFDRKSGTLTRSPIVKQIRALPPIDWHPAWDQYTAEEKRAFLRILKLLLNESSAELLASAGLTDKWDPGSKPKPGKFVMGFPPKPLISNPARIEIIDGISASQVRELFLKALKEREWTLVSETETTFSATYRDDDEDTACTATINGRQIDLIAETHKTGKDGKRVKIAADEGLLEDLNLATTALFLKAPAADSLP